MAFYFNHDGSIAAILSQEDDPFDGIIVITYSLYNG